MKATIATNLDPTSTSGIEGVGHHRYSLIGAWLECESCSINLEGLVTLRLEGLRCSTQGALVLVILYVTHIWLQCNIYYVINYNIGMINEWVHLYV